MIITKEMLAVNIFTADSDTRPELNNIALDADGATATDSYRLARVKITSPEIYDPSIEMLKMHVPDYADETTAVNLSPDVIKKLARSMPDDNKLFAKLGTIPAVMTMGKDTENVQFIVSDVEGIMTATGKNVDNETMPDVDSIMTGAREADGVTVTLSADLLMDIIAYVKKHGRDIKSLDIKLTDPLKPAYITADINNGQELEAVIMPIRK